MIEEQSEQPAEVRRELLGTSYKELLDATKHQDDKIGRIITGISFLTAAVLAFASQIGVDTRFDLGDREAPLLAYAVGTFVVGVVFTVILLLSSITTGLTLPGSAKPSDARRDPVSLIYFYSIARRTKAEWVAEWDRPEKELRAQLDAGYVRETYNLALRTDHKYTRTNEAVTVLSFTLFALGGAFVLAATVAATTRTDAAAPVPLLWQARSFLALFVAGYLAVQVLVARREHFLRLRIRGGSEPEDARRAKEFKGYQYALPIIGGALVLAGRPAAARVAVSGVVVAGLLVLGFQLKDRYTYRGDKPEEQRDKEKREKERLVRFVGLGLAAAIAMSVLAQREVTWRLVAAAGIPALLTLRNVIEQVIRARPPKPPDRSV